VTGPTDPSILSDDPTEVVEVERLDAHPYAAVLGPYRLLGARIAVRCEDSELGAFLAAFLAAFPRASDPDEVLHVRRFGDRWVVFRNGVRVIVLESVEAVARSLVWYLNTVALQSPADEVLVHAAVATLHGRAVLFPGESGAGKTTLAASLALSGWGYLSDEVAPLDRDGLVHAYPRPLALEQGSWALVPDALERWPADVPAMVADLRFVLPATLTSAAAAAPAPVAAIVFPLVAAGEATRLEPLPRAEALERVVRSTFNRGRLRDGGFDTLVRIIRSAECYRLTLDGVVEAPVVLAGMVDAEVDVREL
jgi:hypothetical protein